MAGPVSGLISYSCVSSLLWLNSFVLNEVGQADEVRQHRPGWPTSKRAKLYKTGNLANLTNFF